jgi:hypothetical protein
MLLNFYLDLPYPLCRAGIVVLAVNLHLEAGSPEVLRKNNASWQERQSHE